MTSVKQKKVEEFIEAMRGSNAILRKIASYKMERVRGVRRLKREWKRQNSAAEEYAQELEKQSQRAICADDLMELAGIICRATNTPLEAFIDILGALGIDIAE